MYLKLYEVTFGMRLYLGVSLFMGKYSIDLMLFACIIFLIIWYVILYSINSHFSRPDFKFKEYLREDALPDDQPKKQILKRDSASFEEVFNSSFITFTASKNKTLVFCYNSLK